MLVSQYFIIQKYQLEWSNSWLPAPPYVPDSLNWPRLDSASLYRRVSTHFLPICSQQGREYLSLILRYYGDKSECEIVWLSDRVIFSYLGRRRRQAHWPRQLAAVLEDSELLENQQKVLNLKSNKLEFNWKHQHEFFVFVKYQYTCERQRYR